ncbi:glycoside hydrolase family protein [Paenibacillus sp. FSL R7-269]|uniref:glycoside hydrolase family 1 protein n=1 Tax=Paenibacillus sp. FSL R7-269 TaxID=1226755 RepID=UPI0003E1CB62|nr:glycoside hydrolase family 1 protein [Paenibacillus sp. FSL R7-269]ETT35890.1 glycoside hydrolase family protein [Paenibacillus sp. FSL R7-269]
MTDLTNKRSFPDDFLWGAATSAFQVEGGYAEGGKGLSVADVASFKHADQYADTTIASGFYHKYKQDIQLMAELGLKSYRFSIAWTRIYPNGNDEQPNTEGIAFYNNLINTLLEYGIEPIVTMYHFDMPQALIDQYNGWQSRKSIDDFDRYARTLLNLYGDRVKYWLPINEQNLMIRKDKLLGLEHLEAGEVKEKLRHQINYHMFLAAARAVAACHELCPQARIGPAFAYLPAYPASSRPEDVLAAQDSDRLLNHYLTDTYVYGEYPAYYKHYLARQGWLPETQPGDEVILKAGSPDFIGFNYYVTFAAQYCPPETAADYTSILNPVLPGYFRYVPNDYLAATEYNWQIDPTGFRKSFRDLYDRYQLPLMVTENGLGTADVLDSEGKIDDHYRIDYLKGHIEQMGLAIDEGIPVIGYHMWAFIDIVSSSNGFSKRYGLVYVDRDELEPKELRRVRKESYFWYKRVISSKGTDL